MAYTTIDDPTAYFETILWSSVDTSIDTLDFQPDWVWIKSRTNADTQVLFDAVRGTGKRLSSSGSTEEQTKTDELTAFNSNGFTIGTGDNVNRSGHNYVSWNWKAGTSFTNDASATSIGTIDSTGSVNTDAGFSIVSWTGTGSNGTIKHGLSSTPKMIFCKRRDSDDAWWSYNATIGAGGEIILNEANAAGSNGGVLWNSTAPTSSVFSVGTNGGVNGSGGTYIAYAFADVKGYSKVGNYTGNGNADGTFVYTGFRPAFLMIKNTSTGSTYWTICDSKRDGFNDNNHRLFPNINDAESASNPWEMYSNGFKMTTTGSYVNSSGDNFIYMAFAESPFVTSTGVPTTAR